jgi:hypothetical protein
VAVAGVIAFLLLYLSVSNSSSVRGK